MYDIIIVGSGIAGMTAAIYGARAGKKVAIIEHSYYGGQIVTAPIVENYPGVSNVTGADLVNLIFLQMKSLNVDYINDKVVKVEDHSVVTEKNSYSTKTIIVATGMTRRKLGLVNEDKFIGRGISYCATCDGNFYKDKTVAVVGGGNVALEDAIYLSGICKTVYLIHRKREFTGEKIYEEKLKSCDNVKIVMEEEVIGLEGDSELKGIQLKNQFIFVDGLFIAIGNIPNTDIISDLINCDSSGYVVSNDTTTNVNSIFVAGDVRTKKVRQLITSAADGAEAIYNALQYIKKGE